LKAIYAAAPTASETFAQSVTGKDSQVIESVARSANPDAADPAVVAGLMKSEGLV
jgi:hypothetical protein